MRARVAAAATAALLAGCAAGPSKGGALVRDADAHAVASCTLVGEVHGTSGWGNLAASKGMENAKNEARSHAAELGATHIVWDTVVGGYSPSASGKAYRCQP